MIENASADVIVDITEANAQQMLIEASVQRPVVADFWTEQSEASQTLSPLLERLAHEYGGQFLLAKVNVDTQQAIAGQLGVQSVPTVMVIQNGQPVDGFAGAQPEAAVRELLDKYLPKPWDNLLQQAQALMAEGDFVAAQPLLRQAYSDSAQRGDIACALAHCLLEQSRCDEAETVLAAIKMADQDGTYQQLIAQLELKREAAKTPELQALEAEHSNDPDNTGVTYQLALQYSQSGQQSDALELLLGLLRKELNCEDGAVKKTYQDILAQLDKGDSLAVQYQRKLYTLLY